MTRGIRNNNPLNLRHSADQWQGARKEQTDKSFVQFESMAYGYRAALKTLDSYWNHFKQLRQPFTVRAIISRWAPPSENDTDAYVSTVLRLTSLGGNERLPRPLRGIAIDKLVRLFRAISCLTLCDPWTVACQAPLTREFFRQEYWSGLPCLSPGDLPNPGIKSRSPALHADSLLSEPPGKPPDCHTRDKLKSIKRGEASV